MRGIFREIPTLPSQYAVLVGWVTELPVMVKMRTLLKEQCPQSDDPDFWGVWTRSQDRRLDWSAISSEWQSRSDDIDVV